MPIGFIPVVPKKDPFAGLLKVGALMATMSAFGKDAQLYLGQYPPQQGGVAYRRTRILGKGWTTDGPKQSGGNILMTIGNNVEYAASVQGKKPVKWAEPYGWRNVKTAKQEIWEQRHKDRIARALRGLGK